MTTDKIQHPLMCDPATGICEIPGTAEKTEMVSKHHEKPIKIKYFSDPICSACWGVEPALRRLKLEYGNSIEFEYHMGGLLPSWEAMGGRVNPASLAAQSDEMNKHFQMPFNGEVWIQDPPKSSYPASIAFKAAQMQNEEKAIKFLRLIREDLYVRSLNIAKWEHIEKAALAVGLDIERLKTDYQGDAKQTFQEDLLLAHKMGVRGFPCFIVTNSEGAKEIVYGIKPYREFEAALEKIHSGVQKQLPSNDWKSLFAKYNSMTTKEFADFNNLSFEEAENNLKDLADQNKISGLRTKNGDLWSIIS